MVENIFLKPRRFDDQDSASGRDKRVLYSIVLVLLILSFVYYFYFIYTAKDKTSEENLKSRDQIIAEILRSEKTIVTESQRNEIGQILTKKSSSGDVKNTDRETIANFLRK